MRFWKIFTFLKQLFDRKTSTQQPSFFQLSLDRGENVEEVRGQVEQVVRHFDAPQQMQEVAREAAAQIGKQRISLLFYLLQENRMPSANGSAEKRDIGMLLHHVYENAIFEILYYMGEDAYNLLSNFAFQADHKMPFKAVEVLCRMAAKGIHTNETVRSINQRIDFHSNKEMLPILHALSLIPNHKEVNAIFSRITKRYLENCDRHPKNLRRAVSIIRRWAYSDVEGPRAHLPLLRKLAFGTYKNKRKPACSPEALKFQRVRAALVLDYLEPYDEKVQELFNKWLILEENEEIRMYIAEQLEENEKERAKKENS